MSQKSKEINTKENKLLRNVCYGFLVSGACSQSLGPLIPFFRESFGFGYSLSGTLLSLNSIGNLAAVLLAGVLPAYLGRRKSILITSIWMFISYFIFSISNAPSELIIISCFLAGIAKGGVSTFSNTMVSTLNGDLAAKGYNRSHGSYSFGALISPLLLFFGASFIADFNWRYITGILCFLALTQFVLYTKMELPQENTKKGVKNIDTSFLRNRNFWCGTAMLFFYISAEYAIAGWLVTYFQDTNILSADSSQLMSSLFWGMIFIGRLVGAKIVGKVSAVKLLLFDGVGLICSFLFMFFSKTPLTVTLGLVGVGLFCATIYPTAFSFGSKNIKGNDLGCSLMSFMASIGGILTPLLVGLIASKSGIYAGMGLVVAVVILLFITILISVFLEIRSEKNI